MTEGWVTIFGTNAIAVMARELRVQPGLGRHQLVVPIEVRPTHEAAYDHSYSFLGTLRVSDLAGGGGYLGRFHETTPRRLTVNSLLQVTLCVDVEPLQLLTIESRRNGGFSLNVTVEVKAEGGEWGTTQIMGMPVSRDMWLPILDQTKIQRTTLVELPMPDPQANPALTKAIEHFSNAQRRLVEGEHRMVVESLRQALGELAGKVPEEETAASEVTAAIRAAKTARDRYPARYELVRTAMKFLADLGSHPETDETTPAEARSVITMVGGLLQWYASRAH